MKADSQLLHPLSRRRFLAWLVGAGAALAGGPLLAACGLGSTTATQPRVYRVGYLAQQPFPPGLLEEFAALGYVERTNLVLEPRVITSSPGELQDLAAELVRLRVDCIVVQGPAAAVAAKAATAAARIPVVGWALGADPVASGLVASLARPGGNVTGLAGGGGGLDLKRLEILKEAVPGLARVAIFRSPDIPDAPTLEQFNSAGQTFGLQPRLYEVSPADVGGLERTLAVAVQEGADGLYFSTPSIFNRNRGLIEDFVARSGLPAVYPTTDLPPESGLMSLGGDNAVTGRRIAALVDKVLRGTSPSDIPIESAPDYKLIVNLKTAQALGLTIPQSVLIQAAEVIR